MRLAGARSLDAYIARRSQGERRRPLSGDIREKEVAKPGPMQVASYHSAPVADGLEASPSAQKGRRRSTIKNVAVTPASPMTPNVATSVISHAG